MDKPFSPSARRIAIILLLAASVITFLAIGAYFLTFAPRNGFQLSKNDTAWANFGNYAAGVLGPLFTFLAFVGVLLTIWLQAMQLDSARQQANLEEFQRVLANVSGRIDGILAQPPSQQIDHYRMRNAPITVFTIISAAGTAALSKPTDYIVEATNGTLIVASKQAIATEMTAIGLELDQLAWCLQEYIKQTGNPAVVAFYKRRFGAVTCWIDAIQSLDSHPFIQAVFAPRDFRRVMQPPTS